MQTLSRPRMRTIFKVTELAFGDINDWLVSVVGFPIGECPGEAGFAFVVAATGEVVGV